MHQIRFTVGVKAYETDVKKQLLWIHMQNSMDGITYSYLQQMGVINRIVISSYRWLYSLCWWIFKYKVKKEEIKILNKCCSRLHSHRKCQIEREILCKMPSSFQPLILVATASLVVAHKFEFSLLFDPTPNWIRVPVINCCCQILIYVVVLDEQFAEYTSILGVLNSKPIVSVGANLNILLMFDS